MLQGYCQSEEKPIVESNDFILRAQKFLRRMLDYCYIKSNLDVLLYSSQIESQEIKNLNSVAVILGPYRNLTTLTASVLFLHPNIQVLNHAGIRILGRKQLDFLSNYCEDVFRNFCRYALWASRGGRRGSYGGSIALSHAFERAGLREIFRQRFKGKPAKSKIKSIVWKESQKIANHIKKQEVNLDRILRNSKILFILPIRNPLDCAKSNIRTGLKKYIDDANGGVRKVLRAILMEFQWVLKLEERWPQSIFHFYEYEFNGEMLCRLAKALKVRPVENWIQDVLQCTRITSRYSHSDHLIEYYMSLVDEIFSSNRDIANRFKRFVQTDAI